ncbi:DUF349 domain-containing protein [Bergeyella cardium]|uniref:DUF349 domain-containing protein n=1 Tax=Bergeyella cardium TaxID=1585976 RepID=A0A6P1QS93_9FLAO|nr:DUF349 domain-containing protein [Bergeyella cardium]QHN64649.1 DUF349 domain-containing protein [Bergeyella cardium]WHE33948.1 DUF349 domain-containing protein [Bergeyella cardium]WHF60598.1 DUF349 domain-containing protein [Bergeyella cardium]
MTLENHSSAQEGHKPIQEGANDNKKSLSHKVDQHFSTKNSGLSLEEILIRLEKIINTEEVKEFAKEFSALRNEALQFINQETEKMKATHIEAGNPEEDFSWEHPQLAKLSGLNNIFKKKYNEFRKELEEELEKNKQTRLEIIEKLKNLYLNSDLETNLFKEIRKIKEEWANAGQVAKNEFKLINNNYFYHLNQFYELLNLNKEYLEQEYAHNLEKRRQIISRAKELLEEPVIQKALNELQYLHKLWKEEAEPVAEELRESTWEEFKAISNEVHNRKAQLTEQIEKEQAENLIRKNQIIEEIKRLIEESKDKGHDFWQKAISKVDKLRQEFLNTGSVSKAFSNKNWSEFNSVLKEFNTIKNNFYKDLKALQSANLKAKKALIKIAKDNVNSEDWEAGLTLFKKLQEDWKKIGHVPRSASNKIWEEFHNACNTFFANFREKTNAESENWKMNFKAKSALLEELKILTDEEGSIAKIERIKNEWNAIGKVPKEKIAINREFNKVLKEKLKLNNISVFDINETSLPEDKLTEKARKIKKQIADLEAEVVKMENNINFFNNATRENPLLQESFTKIDEKKAQIEALKKSLHNIISGD